MSKYEEVIEELTTGHPSWGRMGFGANIDASRKAFTAGTYTNFASYYRPETGEIVIEDDKLSDEEALAIDEKRATQNFVRIANIVLKALWTGQAEITEVQDEDGNWVIGMARFTAKSGRDYILWAQS